MSSHSERIQITWDDVNAAPALEAATAVAPVPGVIAGASGARSWGSIAASEDTDASDASSTGSIWLKGWFYLGAAGLAGAFLAWVICEPTFSDETGNGFGNYFLFPLMVILMCIGLGTAESIVERSWMRALQRGLASSGLGLVLGFAFAVLAGLIFETFVVIMLQAGSDPNGLESNPVFWLMRAFAWAIFGMAGGLVFGIVSKSGKKISYGMLGGVIGAGLGGLVFDPISLLLNGSEASRMIGLSILGACTGAAIGFVESAFKDQWLYVSSGPLAGKQFVLYQDTVTIGKDQSRTIYLFKDPDILDHHATIEKRAGRSVLTAFGPVAISGQLLQGGKQHVLRTGDYLQIGRYAFSYTEKERTVETS